ncbi:MAG: cupin domain-containing protein [Chloroflexi bacterium]|nr:cupin domain-containing protein [Chloroflexota bacterium]
MTLINLKDIEEKELLPGYRARFVHSEAMTLAYWTIRAGAPLPEHAHPHEQVTNLLKGEYEITVLGEIHRLKPGKVVVIPSNTPHSGRALSDCRILDVFYPVREEYR